MTTDALLAIAVGVLIPFLLAVAGGALAIKALPPETKSSEKSIWISAFIGLFLVGVVLAFCQQVRMTTLQTTADEKDHQKEVKNEGEIKYTQGQLDSINKVLAQAIQTGGAPDKSLTNALLKGAMQASQARSFGVEPPAIQRMTNAQLKAKVMDFVQQLRKMSADVSAQTRQLSDAQMEATRSAKAEDRNKEWDEFSARIGQLYISHSQQIQSCCVVTATEYRDEMLRRLGPENPSDFQKFPFTFWMAAGTVLGSANEMTLDHTASYLEFLARKLN